MDHRWIARIAVAALHLGLLAALWLHRPPPLAEPADRRFTTVRLITPPPRRPAAAPAPAPARLALPREPEPLLVPPPPIAIAIAIAPAPAPE